MKLLRYVCTQTAALYYAWQVEILIHNFIKNGVNPNNIDIVCGITNGIVPNEWQRLAQTYNYVRFFFYNDTRTDFTYSVTIKPHILKKHFEEHPYLTDDAIFHCDPDIVFTKPVKWDQFVNDDVWYCSDTVSYIGSEYIKKKGYGIYEKMCELVGIDEEIPVQREDDSGGAQFIMKNVTAEYWDKVEEDCNKLYSFFLEDLEVHPETDDYEPIQKWTAEMWAILWNAWYFGHETKVVPEMDFAWSTDAPDKWEIRDIYHNAGVMEDQTDTYFYKGDYTNKVPFGEVTGSVNDDYCSALYVKELMEVAPTSCLVSGPREYLYTKQDIADMENAERLFAEDEKKEFPSRFQMARNLAKDLWNVAKAKKKKLPIIVPSEVAQERYEICQECEHITSEDQCSKCGCYMTAKVNFAPIGCPIKMWSVYE